MRHHRRGPHGPGRRGGKLVLVHIGPNLSTHGPMEQGIGDISRIYNGEIVFSEALMRISL